MVSVAMMPPLTALLLGVISLTTTIHGTEGAVEYYGKFLGHLSRLMHSVSGDVYAVDVRTLHIRDFTYDGAGPAAFFYAGNTKTVSAGGFRVRDETGSEKVLKSYNKKHITVTLPDGKTLNNIKWFSVWCDEFQVNFGSIQIPPGLDYPKPQKIGHLAGVHAVSSENIVVVDAQTLLIPSFSYDGEAPDAKFWVGRGPNPSPQGIRIPDENGKITPLRKYVRKTIVLTLPGDLTVFDIGHFGVWCEAFTVDFGHIQIPSGLNVPPSLKMLGVSPQKRSPQPALQQSLRQENSIHQQQPQQIGFENVLPLFNTELIKPTTFRPPVAHRFAAPLIQGFEGRGQGVHIQSSLSLTPGGQPLVFTQVGNQPLQLQTPQPQPEQQQQRQTQLVQQPQHRFNRYNQQQNGFTGPHHQGNVVQQPNRFNSFAQNYHSAQTPNVLIQPSHSFEPHPQNFALQQPSFHQGRQFVPHPNNLIQPVFHQPSQFLQQPPLQDLPNPYHALVQRRAFDQRQTFNQFNQRNANDQRFFDQRRAFQQQNYPNYRN